MATLEEALGPDYDVLRSHSLQASHVILLVHKSIVHLVSSVRSLAVPTGIGETLGNKGGIGIACKIAETSFIFVNAHLAAHQHATVRRTNEFRKISRDLANNKIWESCSGSDVDLVEYCGSNEDIAQGGANENLLDDGEILPDPDLHSDDQRADAGPVINPLVTSFDHAFWFGDLNFRKKSALF